MGDQPQEKTETDWFGVFKTVLIVAGIGVALAMWPLWMFLLSILWFPALVVGIIWIAIANNKKPKGSATEADAAQRELEKARRVATYFGDDVPPSLARAARLPQYKPTWSWSLSHDHRGAAANDSPDRQKEANGDLDTHEII